MTPQERLEAQRTATRIAPGGARSAVYGQPAGQVPQGILSPGTAPMPAVSSNMQLPNSGANPAMREALTSRPPIDQSIVQRTAQNALQNGRPLYVGGSGGVGGMPPTGASAVRPAAPPMPGAPGAQPSGRFAGVNNPNVGPGGSAEARAWQAQRPGGPTAPAATATAAPGTATAAPGIQQPAAPQAPGGGRIANAARTTGRVTGMVGAGIGEAAKGVGRLAGQIAGPIQAFQGYGQMTGDGSTADKVGGAARLGAGVLGSIQSWAPGFAAKAIPRAGPFGAAAAIGMTAGDYAADPILDWIKSNPGALKLVNSVREMTGAKPFEVNGQPSSQPAAQTGAAQTTSGAPQGAQPAPQRAPVPNVNGPTLADQTGVPQPKTGTPGVNDGSAEERAINAQDNAGPPRGPITRAAQGATMSPEGQAQVARLQQMAGQPQAGPAPAAPVGPNGQTDDRYYRATPGIVGMAAGGDPDGSNSGRAVWGLQLPAMPEERGGQVIVDRGGRESIATQRPEGQLGYDEQVTGIPELQGNSLADMAKWAVDLEARGFGKAPDIIARYAAAQQDNQTRMGLGALRFDESDMTSGRQLQGTQASVAGGVQQANIAAGASRHATDQQGPKTVLAKEPMLDPNGVPVFGVTKETPSYWNNQTRQWEKVGTQQAPTETSVTSAQYDKMVQGLMNKGYTSQQARDYAKGLGVSVRKEN